MEKYVKEVKMFSEKEFKNPDAIWRGAPFWSWNDKLDEKEIIWQIRSMKKAGLGGFFMHARVGLITPYLGKEWMNMIKTAVKEAKKQKMYAYLYDEDKWPSGFAGGLVPAKNPDFRHKYLVCLEREENIADLKLIKKLKIKNQDYYFYLRTCPSGNTWFNGYSYVDLLNPDVTDEFIRTTYDAYKKVCGKEFSKVVPAIFTDEPSIGHYSGESYRFILPWTDDFPNYFKRKNGFNILNHLPSLFFKVDDYKKIRHAYWKAVTEMFVSNFTKRIYMWCEKNNLPFTGHFMCEDTFSSQIHWIGSAMPHYKYMQWPGVDHLGWHIHGVNHPPLHLTMKQVSSVAHQFGKQRVLCELYGVSGWDLTFEGQKWIGDWEYVLGVNLRCQHLALYSLRGCRKRDYPPSINYQQRWWKYYPKVENYFARLGYMLTRGSFVSDILLLHPISSAACVYSDNEKKEADGLFNDFLNISYWLSELHMDYDYGDEFIIRDDGKIKDNKFIINKMSYKVVIIPPSISWFETTVKLLKEFVKNGGKCIAIKPLPYCIDGLEKNSIKELFKMKNVFIINNKKEELEKVLDEILERDVSVCDEKGKEIPEIYYQHRVDGKKHIYFFTNIDLNKTFKAEIILNKFGSVKEYNLENGEIKPLNSLNLEFPPVGSHLLVLDEDEVPITKSINLTSEKFSKQEQIVLDKKWSFKRKDYNALTLDYCQYQILGAKWNFDYCLFELDKKGWSKKVPVWQAQLDIRRAFGLYDGDALRGNFAVQFWKSYQNIRIKEDPIVYLKYNFNVRNLPSKSVYLVLETPERFKIFVNSKEVKYIKGENDWWVDKSFKKVDISKFVKKGNNEIILKCLYREDVELESIYIIGDFAVYGDGKEFYIDKEKDELETGDWVNQGYVFYGGEIVYSQEVNLSKKQDEEIYLELEKMNAVVIKVIINGRSAGLIGWHPLKINITNYIKNGKNKIELEVVSSLRNLLGPHHNKLIKGGTKDWNWVGPGSFSDKYRWTDRYNFVPYGITGDVRLSVWKK
jgi:hypothetical protein